MSPPASRSWPACQGAAVEPRRREARTAQPSRSGRDSQLDQKVGHITPIPVTVVNLARAKARPARGSRVEGPGRGDRPPQRAARAANDRQEASALRIFAWKDRAQRGLRRAARTVPALGLILLLVNANHG